MSGELELRPRMACVMKGIGGPLRQRAISFQKVDQTRHGCDVATNHDSQITDEKGLHDHVISACVLTDSQRRTLFLDGASASDQVVYQYDHS